VLPEHGIYLYFLSMIHLKTGKMENENWVKVFSSNQEYLVEITKSILQDEDIDAVIINKKDSAYHFGECELYVERKNALVALNLISKIESE